MTPIYDRVALIGLGLIASSMAHAMKAQGLAREIAGHAKSAESRAAVGVDAACREILETTGLPACDVLRHGPGTLLEGLAPYLERWRRECRGEKS